MTTCIKVGELEKSGAASTWPSRLSSRLFALHPNRLDYYLPLPAPELVAALPLGAVGLSDAPDAHGLHSSACGLLRARFDSADGDAVRACIRAAAASGGAPTADPEGAAVAHAASSAALGALPSLATACAPPAQAGGGSAPAVSAWVVCSPATNHLLVLKGARPTPVQRGSVPLLGPGWVAAAKPVGDRALEVSTERRAYHLQAASSAERDGWLAAIERAVRAIGDARAARTANAAGRAAGGPVDEAAAAEPALRRAGSDGEWSDGDSSDRCVQSAAAAEPAAHAGGGEAGAPRAAGAGGAAGRARKSRRESSVNGAAMLVCFRAAAERDAQALLRAFGTWQHFVEAETLFRVEELLTQFVERAVVEAAAGTPQFSRRSYVPLGDEYGDDHDHDLSYTPFSVAVSKVASGSHEGDGARAAGGAPPGEPAERRGPGLFGSVDRSSGPASDAAQAGGRTASAGGEPGTPTTDGGGGGADGGAPSPDRLSPPQLATASQLQQVLDELERGMGSGTMGRDRALDLLAQVRARAAAAAGRAGAGEGAGGAATAAHPLQHASTSASANGERGAHASADRARPTIPKPLRSLAVRIRSAETQLDARGQYTAYEVALTDGEMAWSIWRRYSQFEVLHQYMLDERGFVPGLPPKVRFALRPRVVADRRAQLERYLAELTSNLRAFTPEQRKVLGHFLNAPAALMAGARQA